MKSYDHKRVEKKWQTIWEKKKADKAQFPSKKKKFYGLIEFPYPSGIGLHVGHIRSNTAMDIICRKRRMEGYNVLYPIGWDAFGLPTENYAIKTGIHPIKVTKQNTDNFRKQLKALGFSFDWSREINTTDPKYYKWTQWIFLQFFKKGLAYKTKTEINWCPSCKIGLANEEVVGGNCERCGGPTEKREKEQWMLAITKYADRLDKDLDTVDYLPKIKIQQRNWIGKSEGAEINFKVSKTVFDIKVFTTRPDTIFGATYVVLAPEHALIEKIKSNIKNWSEVEEYIKDSKKKTEVERTAEDKVKTGVELRGVTAINPANKEEIPVWIADYVLANYGTGAIMAVPAHDERDYEFAKKYNLPINHVVEPVFIGTEGEAAFRKGEEPVNRNAVCAVVRNPVDDTYLCVSWKAFKMQGLVTGGMEDGESIEDAARREILEETGYKNLKLVHVPKIAIHTFFYHRVKQVNRHARFNFVFFDLINTERDTMSAEDQKLHDVLWIAKKDLKDFFNVFEGEFILNLIDNPDYIHTGPGILHYSGIFSGIDSEQAKKEITKFVGGKTVTKYKLRDWVFSRQRYWGEPIPLINCEKCGWVPVPDKDLPVKLPKVTKYKPTDTGESPLAAMTSWVNVKCPKCKGKAKRETDTMPNWAGSSWYFMRYADPKNNKEFASKKSLKYWMGPGSDHYQGGVNWYNGGMEHTTLHLLYSRFWHKFLYDLKLVPTSEPYAKRTSHGLILADDGSKFSKSKGNGVDPMDIIKVYGADTVRLYEMFMGPFDQAVSWNSDGLVGPRRFLERVWKLAQRISEDQKNFSGPRVGRRNSRSGLSQTTQNSSDLFQVKKALHKTIKKVSEDIDTMHFNTAISSMMMLASEMERAAQVSKEDYKTFLQVLAPFAPHIAEELWSMLGEKKSIHTSTWPAWDNSIIKDDEIKIVIQVNGKLRSELMVGVDESEEHIKNQALSDAVVQKYLQGKEPRKIIYVKNRLINVVI